MNFLKKIFGKPKSENPTIHWNEKTPGTLEFDTEKFKFCGVSMGAIIQNCQTFGKTDNYEAKGGDITLTYPNRGYEIGFSEYTLDFVKFFLNEDIFQPDGCQHCFVLLNNGLKINKDSHENDLVSKFGNPIYKDIEKGVETVIRHKHKGYIIESELNTDNKLKNLFIYPE